MCVVYTLFRISENKGVSDYETIEIVDTIGEQSITSKTQTNAIMSSFFCYTYWK